MNRNNPLTNIFAKDSNGKLTDEIESVKNIDFFFEFLKDDKIKEDVKIKVLEEFKAKLHNTRYISEFFASHNNKSIYLYLFDLYLNQNSTDKIKKIILLLIEELCQNITAGKEIYEYIFQRLSKIYIGVIPSTANNVYNYLQLLGSLLFETDNMVKPKNYFACSSGNCKFYINLNKKPIEVGYSLIINLNFKIGFTPEIKNSNKTRISNLLKISFSNKKVLSIDLQYPLSLIIKDIKNEPILNLSNTEWNNLNITISNMEHNKMNLHLALNGESKSSPFKMNNFPLKLDDTIENIEFFNDFYGEVSSIYMFSQKEAGLSAGNSNSYLSELKNFKGGLWKKKIIDNFLQAVKKINLLNIKAKSIYMKLSKAGKEEKTLYNNLVFLFAPINYNNEKPNIVEDIFCKYQLEFCGNIKNHQFRNYQKRLSYVSGLYNFFPLAEMFLIYPETLDEKNIELFLGIISNLLLNFRRHNFKKTKEVKFFNILSMFIEKYPSKVFTIKILNAFYALAKTLFANNAETLCSNYFKHILLNEKILSKYDENLQIEFWNQLYLFCQSDKTQIETFININRLCLILRFYDRNKYFEICCQDHLNMIKDSYVGSKKVMNPPMTKKLSNLKNIMDLIIESQEPKHAVTLFKLLTLDLSPCLVKFILNIFVHAFRKITNEKWKEKFVQQLLESKYEVIVINTFVHSLPDIRMELLKFVYQVHLRILNTNHFNIFQKMLKTCILPDKMFYSKSPLTNNKSISTNINNKSSPIVKKPEEKKVEPKKTEQKKPEVKPPEPKKPAIIPKKEESQNQAPSSTKKNFMDLLSKFDKSKNPNPSNNIQKPIPKKVEQPKPKEKEQSQAPKSFDQFKDQMMKKIDKKEESIKSAPKVKEEKEKQTTKDNNSNISTSTSSSMANQSNSNSKINKDNSNVNSDNNSDYNKNRWSLMNGDFGEIIIKEDEVKKYINQLYLSFILWSMKIDIDLPFEAIDYEKSIIKVINAIDIVFLLNKEINNKELLIKFINTLNKLVNKPDNCFEIFFNKKIYGAILDLTFDNFQKKGKDEEEINKLGNNILTLSFIGACTFCENQQNLNLNPGKEVDIILLWGAKIIKDKPENKSIILDFMFEIFYEFLLQYKIKFEMKLKHQQKDFEKNLDTNFVFKNYLMFLTQIFTFIFRFQVESEIHNKGTSFLYSSSPKILIPDLTSSMRISNVPVNDISKDWLDFTLIYDVFYRYKYMWTKNNVYQKLDVDKYKKDKVGKYDYIIENLILEKDNRNLFQRELTILCFEDKKGDFECIIPLVSIIPQTIMYVLEKLKSTKNEKDFLYWLKDLKDFIRFLIIATCTLSKSSQSELFKSIQEKCSEPIIAGLCFMNNLFHTSSICKDKIEKSLVSLLLFIFKMYKYSLNKESKNKNIFKLMKKSSKDISNSAIISLLNEYNFLNNNQIEELALEDNNKYFSSIKTLISNKEFTNSLWENSTLKKKLENGFYSLNSYKKSVDYRYDLIGCLSDTFDYSYKKSILALLPKYENELAKYSNNSLEKNIKKRNLYKAFKKHAFSWRGYWSQRELFFSENPQFKYKLINHYTKSFMKPILVPILDISYYLPEFSGFDTKELFRKGKNQSNKNKFVLQLDIEKILKINEQNVQNNPKEKSKVVNKENYLANIYKNSNDVLYEKYQQIANNLEFGKEEEFSYITREESKKKKW